MGFSLGIIICCYVRINRKQRFRKKMIEAVNQAMQMELRVAQNAPSNDYYSRGSNPSCSTVRSDQKAPSYIRTVSLPPSCFSASMGPFRGNNDADTIIPQSRKQISCNSPDISINTRFKCGFQYQENHTFS